MQYLNIILALTAAVSAIDIRAHNESHCKGVTSTYKNAQPDRCYAGGGVSYAWSFVAIPTNWKLSTRSHQGGNCKELVHTFNSNGKDSVCHGAPVNNVLYTGAGYGFINKKRSENIALDSEDCVWKPDLLTLEDGTTYTLTDVEEETAKIIVDYAWNGTAAEHMPSVFDKYIAQ
ncbi:unnamed protein product [Alternaria alternata]